MKRLPLLVCALFVGLRAIGVTAPRVLVVQCGTLITDPAAAPVRNSAIVITDGRITSIGDRAAVPAAAEQLDLSGYTVIPGLIDAHTHLWTGPLTSQTVADPLATLRASRPARSDRVRQPAARVFQARASCSARRGRHSRLRAARAGFQCVRHQSTRSFALQLLHLHSQRLTDCRKWVAA